MSPAPRARRLHGQEGVTSLAELPMDGGGVRAVERLRWLSPGFEPCERVLLDRPELEDGRKPAWPSCTLFPLPASASSVLLEPREEVDAARFEWDGSTLRAQVSFPKGTSFYGAGLAAAPLLRNGRAVVFWNSDAWHFGPETPSLYSSHPFVLAVLEDGSSVGVLADSPRRGQVWIAQDGLEFAFEAEPFDLVRIEASHPSIVVRLLGLLAGGVPLPPLWALGYHQSRWGWNTRAEVLAIAREMRARKIPCDALWLDIQHMDRHRPFTFDPERFPDPEGMLDELHRLGFCAVAIVDPGLPADRAYAPSAEALEQGHFVCDARGEPVRGRVWPGVCHFPDFTTSQARAWWAGLVERFARRGLDGIWIDMNEPSIFRAPTKTLPEDALHGGDGALPAGNHARYHNLYGQLMAQATREGLERAWPDRRPFVLSRAGHLASARFAATWTGDNQATWEDLRQAIPMVLSLGLCGQPCAGPDLGGFDGDPDPELFARWFELGALLPFARGHSHLDACRKEPWAFGPEEEARVRKALELRLELLPVLQAAFAIEPPPVRPVFFADPADARLRTIDDAYLVGSDLLVAPIVEQGADSRRVVLPRGGWYADGVEGALTEASDVQISSKPGVPPLFVRAGSILPTAPGLQRAVELPSAQLELRVCPDRDGAARGWIYADPGEGGATDPSPSRMLFLLAYREGHGTVLEVHAPAELAADLLPRIKVVVREPEGGISAGPSTVRAIDRSGWGWGE